MVIQGINGAEPGANNCSDLKTIGDYDDVKNASDYNINIQRNWDIKKNFCRLMAHTSEDISPLSQHILSSGNFN